MTCGRLKIKAMGSPEDLFALQTEEFYVDRGRCTIDFREFERFDNTPNCGRVDSFLWKVASFSLSTRLDWNSEPERWIQNVTLRHPDVSFRFHVKTIQEEKIFYMRTGDLKGEVIDLKRGDDPFEFITIVEPDSSPRAFAFRRKDSIR